MVKRSKVLMLISNPMTYDLRPMESSSSLSKRDFDVTVFAWDREGGNLKIQSSNGLTIYRCGFKASYGQKIPTIIGFLIFYAWCVLRSLNFSFQVIHCNDIDMLPLGVLIKYLGLRKAKLVYDMHDHPRIFIHKFPFARFLEKILFSIAINHVNHMIVVNQAYLEYLVKLGFSPQHTTCILNVSDLKDEIVTKSRGKRSEMKLFYYGSISRERGVDRLCEVMKRLPNIELILAGVGNYQEEAETLSKKYKNITYLGWISNREIDEILCKETDVIVVLSNKYNLPFQINHTLASPRKLFTAMAMGLPVAVSEGSYMSEIVHKYSCGVVVDIDNIKQTSHQLVSLRNNLTLRHEMGKNGYKAATEYFNWAVMDERLGKLYVNLTQE